MPYETGFSTIEDALECLKTGGMLVVVDDENRENEGDLVCAADLITADQINFMAQHGRGLICLSLPEDQVKRLDLPMMKRGVRESDQYGTAFTVSIDAAEGITTGISASDRALTIKLATDPKTIPSQLTVPGHVFPLVAKPQGVLKRRGHTEASVDLTKLAGLTPGGVICEIMKSDGTMMRLDELKTFAMTYNLPLITISDLVKYRLQKEYNQVCQARLPTSYGEFNQRIYKDLQGQEHILFWMGDPQTNDSPLTRIHSECLTGDVFDSNRCDCGPQLRKSLNMIREEGAGILIYLRQEGRGIGLSEKIKSYVLQDQGLDTVEANLALGHEVDLRNYDLAVRMLNDLNVNKIKLLTNNPDKISSVLLHEIQVDPVPICIEANQENIKYQIAKKEKMGHTIPIITFNNMAGGHNVKKL